MNRQQRRAADRERFKPGSVMWPDWYTLIGRAHRYRGGRKSRAANRRLALLDRAQRHLDPFTHQTAEAT